MTGDLRTHSSQFSLRTGLQPDGFRGLCPRAPEVYPLEEYPVKKEKSSYISATALHRFIPQPASGRSSALPCLAAILVWSKFLWEIHLHSLFFIPINTAPLYLYPLSDYPRKERSDFATRLNLSINIGLSKKIKSRHFK